MPGKKSLLTLAMALFTGTVRLVAECSSAVVVQAPPTACKSGTATVAVAAVPGATYAWTVDGGTIAGDATGDRIIINLGTNDTATASVTVTAGTCTSRGSSVIALRGPFGVRPSIPAANANEPLTIAWTYDNGAPARQTISSSDFGSVTLAPEVRSYTYTPETGGGKQIVFDAVMRASADPAAAPVSSRRRAVANGPAGASACSEVLHTMVPYTVGECVAPSLILDAPDSIVADTAFQLSVVPQPNAVATWTITNGSPATATGDSVMVTPVSTGTVDVSVHMSRGTCSADRKRSIPIAAKAVCNNPKAVVSAGRVGCGVSIVNTSFTGTPPFRGMWSDGVPFTAAGMSIARYITAPGTYSIISFEDAACAGTASGVVAVPIVGPAAVITANGNGCVGADTMTVHFTGKPPFTGRWSDNTSFVTNEMQIEKPVTELGYNTLSWVYDATDCYLKISGGVQGRPRPSVVVDSFCLAPEFENVVLISATFHTYAMPLTVTWSDSVTQSTSEGDPVWRSIQPLKQTTTFTAVSAHDAYCTATIDVPSVTVYASPIPDFHTGLGDICAGTTMGVSLDTPPPPGAQINWFASNGIIVSGQGTSSIQYKAGDVGVMTLGCTFTYPETGRCPTSHRQQMGVKGAPDASISLDKNEIHAGETAIITITMNNNVWTWSLDDTLNDPITQLGNCGANGSPCHYLYQSAHAGKSKITLHATGFCPDTKDVSIDLNILP
ncbi:MAG: hypothetical protein QOI58_3745 [Thermoanaerobaculia bacterium]|nr:hypothetical protein [Thermoanaerobaculia bacterium]